MNTKNGDTKIKLPGRNLFGGEHLDVVGVLLRRWPLVAAGLAVGLLLGGAYYFVASTKYESESQILVMKKDSNLSAHGMETSTERGSEVSEDLMATHMQIVQSPRIIRDALKKHTLEGLPSIQRRLASDETEVDYIIDHLKVSRGGTGQARLANVLNVTFRHVSDKDCESVLGAIVESYQEFLADKFQDVSKEAVKLITDAKDKIGKDLDHAELEYQHFREQAPLLWNGDNTSSNAPRMNYERLQSSIAELEMNSAAAKTRLDTVEQTIAQLDGKTDDLDLLSLIDDKHVDRLTLLVQVKVGSAQSEEFQRIMPGLTAFTRTEHEGLLPLQLREATLLADYGPEHPLVQNVRAQMRATKEFVEKKEEALKLAEIRPKLDPSMLVQAYVKLLKNDLDTIDLQKKEMQQLSDREEAAAKELVYAELKGDTLRTEVKRKQDLYDAVLDRLRELNLVGAYGKLVTEVIAPVEIGEKVWPKAHWVLLLGAMLGLVLGGGAALGAEQLDRSFRNEEDVRQTLDLPVLTRLATLKRFKNEPAAAGVDSTGMDSTGREAAGMEAAGMAASGMGSSLVAFHRPKSREAEAFRGLRTSLFFGNRGRRQQIIMCTSANPGDGKTLLNTNLAVSIAQSGRRVLLIDADMRRPRVHELFGLKNEVGLAAVLRGEIDPPDAVQTTAMENLWSVPCGAAPTNPAELLASPEFEQCLQLYREHYDFILIDCPPVLAVADPCIIAPLADAVILAVRLVKDMRSQVLRAKEQLEGVDANVIGVFVNGVSAVGKGYGKYGYGGYGSAYGYGGQGSGAYYEEDGTRKRRSNGSNGDAESPDNSFHGRSE